MTSASDEAREAASEALARLEGLTVATAESLTAGRVSATLAEVSGISAILRGGVVAYASEVKARVLGVDSSLLLRGGPVQEEVALQMARGACHLFGADLAVATTGVAGPGPSEGVAAGTVIVAAVEASGRGIARRLHLDGTRDEVRWGSVTMALRILYELREQLQGEGGYTHR